MFIIFRNNKNFKNKNYFCFQDLRKRKYNFYSINSGNKIYGNATMPYV